MNCAELASSIGAYGDGELAGAERERIERHVADCALCAQRSRLHGRFKAAVRAHLPRPPVPPGLRHRLEGALQAQPIAPRRWPWLTHPRLVPAAVAAVLLVAITGTVRHTQSVVLAQAQRSYRSELPMDIVGSDCGSIASWFRGRVDFPVPTPLSGAQGACQGGRLVNVGDRPAAYLMYRVPGAARRGGPAGPAGARGSQEGHDDGHRVAFLVFDPRDEAIEAPQRRVVNGREIYLGSAPGVSTAAYRERGLGYVVTSDLDEDALTNLVTASFQR